MLLRIGEQAPQFSVKDIQGNLISLEDYLGKKLMLCFFRYAGCPFCALVLQEIISRYPHWQKQGLNVVAFFQSPKETILKYPMKQNPPFPIIADPNK